jgi:hypothetical protein
VTGGVARGATMWVHKGFFAAVRYGVGGPEAACAGVSLFVQAAPRVHCFHQYCAFGYSWTHCPTSGLLCPRWSRHATGAVVYSEHAPPMQHSHQKRRACCRHLAQQHQQQAALWLAPPNLELSEALWHGVSWFYVICVAVGLLWVLFRQDRKKRGLVCAWGGDAVCVK